MSDLSSSDSQYDESYQSDDCESFDWDAVAEPAHESLVRCSSLSISRSASCASDLAGSIDDDDDDEPTTTAATATATAADHHPLLQRKCLVHVECDADDHAPPPSVVNDFLDADFDFVPHSLRYMASSDSFSSICASSSASASSPARQQFVRRIEPIHDDFVAVDGDTGAINNALLYYRTGSGRIDDDDDDDDDDDHDHDEPTIATSSRDHEQASDSEFECPICLDVIDVRANTCTIKPCGHKYCNQCIAAYAYDSNDVDILCPAECGTLIDDALLEQLLSESDFQRLQQRRFVASMRAQKNCRWCPRAGCDTPVIVDESEPTFPMVTCSKDSCRYEFCFHCNRGYHAGMTCEQLEHQTLQLDKVARRNAAKFAKYQRKNRCQVCPSCQFPVKKISGCNKITCSCGTSFCYLCGEQATYAHFSTPGPCNGKLMTHTLTTRQKVAIGAATAGAIVMVPPIIFGLALVSIAAIPVVALAIPVAVGVAVHVQRQEKRRRRRHMNRWLG